MRVGSKEFYDMIAHFERIFYHMCLDKEIPEMWSKGRIFQSGETNNAYQIFSQGYAVGRVAYMD